MDIFSNSALDKVMFYLFRKWRFLNKFEFSCVVFLRGTICPLSSFISGWTTITWTVIKFYTDINDPNGGVLMTFSGARVWPFFGGESSHHNQIPVQVLDADAICTFKTDWGFNFPI